MKPHVRLRGGASRVTSKGQVTIPVGIRRRLGLQPRDNVVFLVEDGAVRLMRDESVTDRTAGMLRSEHPRLSPAEEEEAAELAMAEEAEKGR